jgi:hypothetical protein
MSKRSRHNKAARDANVPRQVRMPPFLDRWLEKEAKDASSVLETKTVADKIREIVAAAYDAKQQSDQQAA